jgi:5-(carboxyamino)imidazole ribonucleotide synthase
MSFKKNINGIKKNYSLGIIGGGQLALMLTEAAKKKEI